MPGGSRLSPAAADSAIVSCAIFVGLALWTAMSFVLAVVVGHALRRVQPIPVCVSNRRSR